MCGIVGYLNLSGTALDPAYSCLDAMCQSIEHRGPDEQGKIIIGSVALGMTRLSIIDLKTGQQPIFNEDNSICIVFNGEIYNFHELRTKLLKLGHSFKTHSDTETIIHLYEEYGIDCLQHLEGMFAFAIWDNNKKSLFIARDRMGEKPLHWGVFDGQFIFASEIKAIFKHPNSRCSTNFQALRQYLAMEYVPAPNTMFEDIHKLLPAHYMIIEAGQIKINRYWSPNLEIHKYVEQEAKERLLELLDNSIKTRLISEVPLGVFLSGGIDSSLITALAIKHIDKPLQTFSIGFSDRSFDESSHAKTVAEHLGTEHKTLECQPNMASTALQELWQILDEPIGDASIIPTYILSKMTKLSVTVALSGEGGDELFGGYPTYLAHQLVAIWNTIPTLLRKALIEPLIHSLPVSTNNLSLDYKLKRFITSSDLEPIARQLCWMGGLSLKYHKLLLKSDILKATDRFKTETDLFDHLDMNQLCVPHNSVKNDVADIAMRLDQLTYLPDDLLVKSDRATMAASLEARLPFLAYPLVEFAQSLPTSFKIRGTTSKYLLRKLASDYLPKEICNRSKKGFGIPTAEWIKSEFKPLTDKLLSEEYLRKQEIFEPLAVRQIFLEHCAGNVDHRKELWTLLMFQCWWNKFFNSN